MGPSHFDEGTDRVGANPPWLPWLWSLGESHGGTTPIETFPKWDAPDGIEAGLGSGEHG
ncbi:MAG: hypothetical protein VKK80_14515 [Prochlorothrix sp.]|nr:hypothetical protein [Prochlorothrix sp.]